MTSSSNVIDLNFKPKGFFWPLALQTHVVSSIKGAERKKYVKAMFSQGRESEIPGHIIQATLEPAMRQATGALHPWFMGGEYLPSRQVTEVEIARITIASTTRDVTCVYARRGKARTYYRAVDEYEGETLGDKNKCCSKLPLTLGKLADFFLDAWDLLGVLEGNFGDEGYPPDEVRAFFEASSEFYPDFGRLIEQRVEAWLQQKRAGLDEDTDEGATPETSAASEKIQKP